MSDLDLDLLYSLRYEITWLWQTQLTVGLSTAMKPGILLKVGNERGIWLLTIHNIMLWQSRVRVNTLQ